MPIGTVKFFNDQKGYGFIAPEDGGNDAFVHITAVERAGMRTLQKDQRVSYELEEDRRGKMSAVNLQSALPMRIPSRFREDLRPAPPRAGRAEGARS
jgi:CspA family cold shock protein